MNPDFFLGSQMQCKMMGLGDLSCKEAWPTDGTKVTGRGSGQALPCAGSALGHFYFVLLLSFCLECGCLLKSGGRLDDKNHILEIVE